MNAQKLDQTQFLDKQKRHWGQNKTIVDLQTEITDLKSQIDSLKKEAKKNQHRKKENKQLCEKNEKMKVSASLSEQELKKAQYNL